MLVTYFSRNSLNREIRAVFLLKHFWGGNLAQKNTLFQKKS